MTDKYRYHLVIEEWVEKGKSATNKANEYHIERTSQNPPLILIDTPGFGDTRGSAQDVIISK